MGALDGLTILVTRPEDRAAQLRAMLEAHGAAVVVSPTIAVTLVSIEEANALTTAWGDRTSFDWFVVVSPTIAQLVVALVARDGTEGLPRMAAVGDATAAGLRGGGFEVRFQPNEATGAALATGLAAHTDLQGKRVLWPRGDRGRTDGVEILRGAGAEVVSPILYSISPLKPATKLAERIAAGDIDLVLFASPSAVTGYLLGESAQRDSLPAIAIGPTTAEAVTAAGLLLAGTADPHTAEGLAQAVLDWATSRPR